MIGRPGAVAVLLAGIASCGSLGGTGTTNPPRQSYPQHFQAEDSAVNEAPYDTTWGKLVPRCSESAADVALYVDNLTRLLRSHGQSVDHLDAMRDMVRAIPLKIAPTKCDQIAGALLTLSENGQ